MVETVLNISKDENNLHKVSRLFFHRIVSVENFMGLVFHLTCFEDADIATAIQGLCNVTNISNLHMLHLSCYGNANVNETLQFPFEGVS